ncbi:PucR family transcriptional regulator [Streptacidiphilus sp. PB12-B1b]|uniref:PucR family transcriptional regulator n=1 Tax=Streptacidiphilus sp. PB12-B1b TaxID=2705012 RepID=UPI0015FE6B99|nr:helix-turn-helix domain-containing protein [Streptacidiphilus sp. PB12-B1b]QMU74997.1 PucR family transcriptional regulator [Streptacidiphilus sp. PB12-B1b]
MLVPREAPECALRDRPWAVLPAGFAAVAAAENTRLGPEIVREIRRRIPEYARPLDGRFGAGIQRGAARALAQFAELIADDRAAPEDALRVYRSLGRGEWREGRSLDALQAAYRLGARIAWRRYAQAARQAGMPPAAMTLLADAIFVHVDEMAAASVEGYAQARARDGAARVDPVADLLRNRERLVRVLAAGGTEQRLNEAANAGRWAVPERIAGVALLPGGSHPETPGPAGSAAARLLRALPSAVAALDGPEPCLFLADPDALGRADRLARALAGRTVVVGPAVPVGRAAQSLRWARTVAARLPADAEPGVVHCDRQLASVLLLADEDLVRLLAERRLGPLDGMPPKRRQRLEETLLAWLETCRGSAPEVAQRLGLHPQTVRQRMRQIDALFGAALVEPDARFEIEVALRGRLLLAGRTG